jgi:hypothetical protein
MFRVNLFVSWSFPCYTCLNLDVSEPANLKSIYGVLVEVAGKPDIEGVVGNIHAPQLWKGEPDGLAGVFPWEAPVLF